VDEEIYMKKSFLNGILQKYPGKMVTVNNHKMHVYSEGNGNSTLVFLSGSGTYSPMYDFKILFSKMSNDYKIAVVERAGYGFSEITDTSRDIDTVLFETRTALLEANIKPPYILFSHSMSGIEALYWGQCYPSEINAIVGIDPALPAFYANMDYSSAIKKLIFISKILNGKLKCLLPLLAYLYPPIKYGKLDKTDKKICRALFFHRTLTNDMLNETKLVTQNAKKIDKEKIKTIPMLIFISNLKGDWEKFIRDYAKDQNAEIVNLDGGHCLHDIFPDEIADRSKIFIKNIINK